MKRIAGSLPLLLIAGLLATVSKLAHPDSSRLPPPRTPDGKSAIDVRRPREVFERRAIPKDDGQEAAEASLVIFFPDVDVEVDDEEPEAPPPPPAPSLQGPPTDALRKPSGAYETLKRP